MTPAIEAVNVTKIYRRYARLRQFATLKSALLKGSLIRDLQPDETFPALRGVSFAVPKGCTYGIIGRNGSGKSTLLKCVAGITRPNEGTVTVNGRISALIELGAGFHPEISGRENVFINGIMLGLSRREIQRRFDEIVEFAELRDFIDAPVKTYSSGMYMRLGFAVAINVDPDVLLIDEVLAVGDQAFTAKCIDKFAEFRRRNKTILLVTHSLDMVERFCDRALWLDKGKTLAEGEPKRVVAAYLIDVQKAEEAQLAKDEAAAVAQVAGGGAAQPPSTDLPSDVVTTPADMFQATEGRWGSREVEITEVTLLGADGTPGHLFQSGDPLEIRLKTRAHAATKDFVFGIGLFNADGVCCYGTNTNIEELEPSVMNGDGEIRFRIASLELVEGTYKIDVAAHKRDGYPYDYHRLLYTFRVKSRTKDVGIYRPEHQWQFTPNIQFKNEERRTKNEERKTGNQERRTRMVLSREEAIRWVEDRRAQRHTIVFTNGVFDLIHPGHIRYLREARALGDALIVAVNSDRSAGTLDKGPGRPLNPAGERAEVLAAFACVDAVVVFDEDTPLEIVRALQPDVLVKGADWAPGTIVGADIVEARGGRVVRIALAEGYSTSRLVEKIRGKTG